jgi:hypothetical protein
MVSPPHSSTAICSSGTPVSVIRNTSKRQQQAWQFEQVTSVFNVLLVLIAVRNIK